MQHKQMSGEALAKATQDQPLAPSAGTLAARLNPTCLLHALIILVHEELLVVYRPPLTNLHPIAQ